MPKRQRDGNAGHRKHQRDEKAAPARRLDRLKAEVDRRQEEDDGEERHDREDGLQRRTRVALGAARDAVADPHQDRGQDDVVDGEFQRRRRHQRVGQKEARVVDVASGQEDEGGDRKDEQHEDDVGRLERSPRNEQRDQPSEEQHEDDVHAPAQRDRIEPVDELREIGPHIGPAAAEPVRRLDAALRLGGADVAPAAAPHAVDEDELDRRHENAVEDIERDDRRQRVAPGREEIFPDPADRPGRPLRRRRRGEHLLAHEGEVGLFLNCTHDLTSPPAPSWRCTSSCRPR